MMKLSPSFKFIKVTLFVVMCAFSGALISGCELSENQLQYDREANANFQDFRDALAPRMDENEGAELEGDGDIPGFQSYVVPPSDNIKPMPLVSISINQSVPLRDALFELAKEADYDIELDPNISGSIIFTARNKPFDMVIDRIAEIAGLRYKFQDGSIRVEEDQAYLKSYKVDYLNYIRTNTSTITNSIGVVSGEGASTGSEFEAGAESVSDFWADLEMGIVQILGVDAATGRLRSSRTPQITSASSMPAPVQSVVSEDGTVQVQPPNSVLQVTSLPVDPDDPDAGTVQAAVATNYSMNRQAGMITVFATERKHREMADYLLKVKKSVTSQVLIEAKILEVTLTDEFATGIDWSRIFSSGHLDVDATFPQQSLFSTGAPPTAGIDIGISAGDIRLAVDALSSYGTVRALASPRITVLNNQSAVLNVAKNLVYFDIDIDITSTETGIQTNVNSEIQNVPEGVLINVMPSINLEDRTIAMAIRPTITSVTEFVADPGVPLALASVGDISDALADTLSQVESSVPVVDVQEFDSVIEVPSGEAVVMGGLMKDRIRTSETGVPVLSEVPLFGSLFKSHTDQVQKTELVVFLKATIVEGSNVHETDRQIYKKFSGDRRPFDL